MSNMRLKLILPVVDPEKIIKPEKCPHQKGGGRHFKIRQEVKKAVRDSKYEEVRALRYESLKCRRTFRVYPQGVQAGQVSQRVKGMAVMLYILGLSYGAVAIVLEAGVFLSKTSVYRAVQAAGEAIPGMKRSGIVSGYRTQVLGADLTYVKCKGKWLPIGVIVDPMHGMVLSIDHLSGEDAQELQEWIIPIADAVGAQTLVSDLPPSLSFVTVEPERLVVTAIKLAEDDPERLVIQFFNTTDEPVTGARVHDRNVVSAKIVNLNEEESKPLELQADGNILLKAVEPKKIITLVFAVV